MMNFHVYFSFLCLISVLAYTPGPNVLLMIRNGLEYQIKDAVFSIPGILLAILTYALIVALGLSQILMKYPMLYHSIKNLGSIYLIFIGIVGLKNLYLSNQKKQSQKEGEVVCKGNRLKLFTSGYICAITNPKIFVMYLAFFPQFINPNQNPTLQFLVLGFSHVMITTSSMTFYCLLANKAQHFIKKHSTLQLTCTNVILVLFGTLLIFFK
jgi:threonine/homoserine/homoserine lactone efflux protein